MRQSNFRGEGRPQPSYATGEINALLISLARTGRRVVRLKGGDPFVFGRGGEEAEALARNGVPFVIIPGVTSASGCTAYAGIPLTQGLIAHGLAADTQAAAIIDGTRPEQQTLRTTLAMLPERLTAVARASTILLVIGRVISLADMLTWPAPNADPHPTSVGAVVGP